LLPIKGIKPQGKPWTQNEKVYNPAASGRGIKNHNKASSFINHPFAALSGQIRRRYELWRDKHRLFALSTLAK
jgi:hypothetical protein